MSRHLSTRNISSKSMHAFFSNLANRQTDKQIRAKHVPPPLSEVNMCLSCTVTDIFAVQYWCGLEIWAIAHSRSLNIILFESLGTVSYSHSIATMIVSLAVSTQYTNVTDRRTDTARRHGPRLYIASRGKNRFPVSL